MKKRPKGMLEDTLIDRDRFSAEELQVIDDRSMRPCPTRQREIQRRLWAKAKLDRATDR